MKTYAGIDVSLEASSVCVVDAEGGRVREAKLASEPGALVAWFAALPEAPEKIGLEAGPLSQWLYAGLRAGGLHAELIETRAVRDAFRSAPVKTDRKDARGIANLMRMGWYRPVHCKSAQAQETRALLTARALLRAKRHDVEMGVRGIFRGFGLKVGKVTAKDFPARVRELAAGHAILKDIAAALLKARAALDAECAKMDARVRAVARKDPATRLLMTAPGVGPIVALTYRSAIDDPHRIARSRNVGAYFGLTQRRYQSGETDRAGAISKCGDAGVRAALYEAAHVLLTSRVKGGALKSWGLRLRRRIGPRRAKVAVARKLATVLHKMWLNGTPFDPALAAAA